MTIQSITNDNNSFCIMPWVHLHTSPSGKAGPCCISEFNNTENGVGDSKTHSLIELVNSEKMNNLRINMLNGIKNNECIKCYDEEDNNNISFRKDSNRIFKKYIDDAIKNTNIDGSLSKFKMRYFDIRFNNICNFKCRTCGSGYSSQWEQEDLKNNVSYAKFIPKNNNKEFLSQVLSQIEHVDLAYFAGGEPLITEEHYLILEELIRLGRTDILLRYNTNLSTLKFKDKDLFDLWKNFNKIEVSASVDHYGERAEYIRSGTDWGTIESNLLKVKKISNVQLNLNTVLSVFNYLTLPEFYNYLSDKGLYNSYAEHTETYKMSDPDYLTSHILPLHLKKEGTLNILNFIKTKKFSKTKIMELINLIKWTESKHTWDQHRELFVSEIHRLDNIRGESFEKTFPELAELLK